MAKETGKFTGQNYLTEVEPAVHAGKLSVVARLDEFRNVQDGWLAEGGLAPDHAGLDWLSKAFAVHYPDDLPPPYTYLMADGGVSLEWSLGTKEISVEVDIKTRRGEWFVYDRDRDVLEDETVLVLVDATGWSQLSGPLRVLVDQQE